MDDGWSDRTGELAYLEAQIPVWIGKTGADPSRVYLSGFSSGSNMAFYAASHATDAQLPLAGIAPISGWMDRGFVLTGRTKPVRLFYMLGQNDVVPPAGSATFYSMDEVAGVFTGLNGCGGAAPVQTSTPSLQQKQWACGVDDTVVVGGGHCVPDTWASGTGCHGADFTVPSTDLIAQWVLAG